MDSKSETWQQKIKAHPVVTAIIIVIGMLGIALLVVLVLGYIFNWGWVGLGPYTPPSRDSNFQRGKTLWDWLQLLVIPLMLAIGGFWLNQIQKRRDERATEQRAKIEREIAADNQQEAVLQAYLDKMSELLFKEHLGERTEDLKSKLEYIQVQNIARLLFKEHLGERTEDLKSKPKYIQVQNIARIRTLTILPRLDAKRKASVLLFLHVARLINKDQPIVDLSGVTSRTFQSTSRVLRANLQGADLMGAFLSDACLVRVDLSGADLSGADLSGTDLSGANLSKANLSKANLSEADLSGTDLSGTDLSEAELGGANLRYATLSGAKISGANLENARGITAEELKKQAKSLKGATMLDGSKNSW